MVTGIVRKLWSRKLGKLFAIYEPMHKRRHGVGESLCLPKINMTASPYNEILKLWE